MTRPPAIIAFEGIVKEYGGDAPLRVRALALHARERMVLSGLNLAAGETVMHLISAAALPDEGQVIIAGADTRAIATDTQWLLSLDRFGMVTRRAILLETMTTAANLALPITVAVEPMDAAVRARIESLADAVELPYARLDVPCLELDAKHRLRLHLARALATDPEVLLLEHPTVELKDEGASREFGAVVARVAAARDLALLAITQDAAFARSTGARRWTLNQETGRLSRDRWWSVS